MKFAFCKIIYTSLDKHFSKLTISSFYRIEDDTTLTTNDLSEINAVHSLLVVLCLLARCRQLVGHRYKVGFTLLFSNSSQTMFVGSVNTFESRETCSELVSECYLMFANSLHTRLKLRLNTYKDYSMVNYKKFTYSHKFIFRISMIAEEKLHLHVIYQSRRDYHARK